MLSTAEQQIEKALLVAKDQHYALSADIDDLWMKIDTEVYATEDYDLIRSENGKYYKMTDELEVLEDRIDELEHELNYGERY